MNSKKIPIYGDGSNIRDWLYVEDHIDALLLSSNRGKLGDSYCIGGNEAISNINLALQRQYWIMIQLTHWGLNQWLSTCKADFIQLHNVLARMPLKSLTFGTYNIKPRKSKCQWGNCFAISCDISRVPCPPCIFI